MDEAAAGGGLQRSEISFRRTGSSGLVWDDKFLGELAKIKPVSSQDQDPTTTTTTISTASSADPTPTLQRSRSHAAGSVPAAAAAAETREKQAGLGYKTMKEPSPSVDPPSPKVSGCGPFCSVFGDTRHKQKKRTKVVAKRRL